MIHATTCRPPHSAIVIADGDGGTIPEEFGESPVAATRDCIMVGTLCSADGETSITLSDDEGLPDVGPQSNSIVAFEGILEFPSGRLAVTLVDDTMLFELAVPNLRALVTVWVNDASEPDNIWIQVSPTK